MNLELDISNDFSYIKSQTKTLEYFLLRELIIQFKLNRCEYENFSLSFNTIIINEFKNDNNENYKNLIICLENKVTIKTIFDNLLQLIKEMNYGDNLIINYVPLFTYPSIEILIVILNLFKKIKIYYCKILKQNILYCVHYKNNPNITVFIKNIFKKCKNSNIRQLSVNINPHILAVIKIHNCYIFDYYLNLNDNMMTSTLDDKEYLFKHYYKKYSNINTCPFECTHDIKEFNLQNCYICIKCNDLFHIH